METEERTAPYPARQPAAAPQLSGRRVRVLLAGLMALMALLWNVVEDLPMLLSPGFSLYQVVWMRYAAHLLMLLLFLAVRGQLALVRTGRPALQVGRGLLMLAMPFFFITAFDSAPRAGFMAVFWVAPFMVLALAALLQGDIGRWPTWLATGAALAAVWLTLRPDHSGISASYALMALGMAFSFSLYVVLTRTLRSEPTATNLFYTAVAVLAPLSLLMPVLWQTPSRADYLVMLVVGLAGLGLLWALDRACALVPVSVLAPYLLLPPVIAAILQPWLTGVDPSRSLLAGVALALVAAPLAWWSTRALQNSQPLAEMGLERGG